MIIDLGPHQTICVEICDAISVEITTSHEHYFDKVHLLDASSHLHKMVCPSVRNAFVSNPQTPVFYRGDGCK